MKTLGKRRDDGERITLCCAAHLHTDRSKCLAMFECLVGRTGGGFKQKKHHDRIRNIPWGSPHR